MRCKTTNCFHVTRNRNNVSNSSWTLLQICPCCCKQLFIINPALLELDLVKVCSIRCRVSKQFKYSVPLTSLLLQIMSTAPITFEEIQNYLETKFSIFPTTKETKNCIYQSLAKNRIIRIRPNQFIINSKEK